MAYDFTNPFGMVQSQPSLNLPTGLISTTPQQKLNPMAVGKNETLALMLNALGGALRGDEDFIQNTLQLQQMQEGKRKAAERKAKQEKLEKDREAFIKNNPDLAGPIRMNQLFGFNTPAAKDRRIVLQNGVQYYADDKTPVIPNAPGKTKTTKQEYDDLAAKIKIEIATNGRDSPNLTKNQKDFYDEYIKTGNVNPLNQFLTGVYSSSNQNNNQNSNKTPVITTQEEYDNLPSGSLFIEDGKTYRKP
jgi:hypothetical protein